MTLYKVVAGRGCPIGVHKKHLGKRADSVQIHSTCSSAIAVDVACPRYTRSRQGHKSKCVISKEH